MTERTYGAAKEQAEIAPLERRVRQIAAAMPDESCDLYLHECPLCKGNLAVSRTQHQKGIGVCARCQRRVEVANIFVRE